MLRVPLRRWIGTPNPRQRSDGELLACFVSSHDEGAFAALVTRYERPVLRVCLGVLRHQHDAEDARQKTFLVLFQKAASIRERERIGSWLRGTAYRVAKNVRKRRRRRQVHESLCESFSPAQPVNEVELQEFNNLLNAEAQGLPENLRIPFILCCLEGKSKEAAQELDWNEGTLSGRLAKSRKLMQRRLERRGVAPPSTRRKTAEADCR